MSTCAIFPFFYTGGRRDFLAHGVLLLRTRPQNTDVCCLSLGEPDGPARAQSDCCVAHAGFASQPLGFTTLQLSI